MNRKLARFAKQQLREDLQKCTDDQRHLFKRLYGDPNDDIEDVIDNMNQGDLEWAVTQVENTLNEN